MYSKNKYCRSCREREELDASMSEEERELCRYELPPKYDGSRFSRNRKSTLAAAHSDSEASADTESKAHGITQESSGQCNALADSSAEEYSDITSADGTSQKGSELSRLLGGLSHEELLIISLILIVAGSDDSGELMLLLLLLLIQT